MARGEGGGVWAAFSASQGQLSPGMCHCHGLTPLFISHARQGHTGGNRPPWPFRADAEAGGAHSCLRGAQLETAPGLGSSENSDQRSLGDPQEGFKDIFV